MSIRQGEEMDRDCSVVGMDGDVVSKIAGIFGCSKVIQKLDTNFDIQFSFGTKFFNRY